MCLDFLFLWTYSSNSWSEPAVWPDSGNQSFCFMNSAELLFRNGYLPHDLGGRTRPRLVLSDLIRTKAGGGHLTFDLQTNAVLLTAPGRTYSTDTGHRQHVGMCTGHSPPCWDTRYLTTWTLFTGPPGHQVWWEPAFHTRPAFQISKSFLNRCQMGKYHFKSSFSSLLFELLDIILLLN